jgi:hypothetical protein
MSKRLDSSFRTNVARCHAELIEDMATLASTHRSEFGPALATVVSMELRLLLEAGACPAHVTYILNGLRPTQIGFSRGSELRLAVPFRDERTTVAAADHPIASIAPLSDVVRLMIQLRLRFDRLVVAAALAAVLRSELVSLARIAPQVAERAWHRLRRIALNARDL